MLVRLTNELERAAGAGNDTPSLAVWSNVLRCVHDAGSAGLGERELPAAARISKRLATAAVTGSARRGWITVGAASGSPKQRHAALTDSGRRAAHVWPEQLAAADSEWAGSDVRSALESLVARLPFELPHYPASYGAADPSAIGGPFAQPWKKTDVPAHGNDWSPVPRTSDSSVSTLPITALLSQALMAFTIDYENRFPWPLASTATVLCHIGEEPMPLDDVPGDHGIMGNGKSLLERHLIVEVTKDPASPRQKLVALTDRGVAVMKHHPGRLEAVEDEWSERFGDTVAALRDALTAADPAPGPDHVIAPLHEG